jgi:DNA-binding NtrC family response regulator
MAMRRMLVVDDDRGVRQTIVEAASEWKWTAFEAQNAREARSALGCRPDLLFVDVHLPDASGMTIMQAALTIRPIPTMIAISGDPSPQEAFELARLGVCGYLSKPLSLDDLRAVKEAIMGQTSAVDVFAAARVGKESLQDVQAGVRRIMVEQALAMTAGNRTEAARLLGVSRQAVQQIIRDIGLK